MKAFVESKFGCGVDVLQKKLNFNNQINNLHERALN